MFTSARFLVCYFHIPALSTCCRLQNTLIGIIPTIGSTYGIFNFGTFLITSALGAAIGIRDALGIVLTYLILARIYRKTRTSATSVQSDFTTVVSWSTHRKLPLKGPWPIQLRKRFQEGLYPRRLISEGAYIQGALLAE